MTRNRLSRRIGVTILFAIISCGFASTVFVSSTAAHKGASGIVKQRMDTMKEMKGQLKLIEEMLEGKTAFNDKIVKNSLDYIQDQAGSKMTKMFPKGSGHKPSEADPAIWENWSKFEKLANQLNHSTDEFEAILRADSSNKPSLKPLRDSYLSIRKVCKDCHDHFRE